MRRNSAPPFFNIPGSLRPGDEPLVSKALVSKAQRQANASA